MGSYLNDGGCALQSCFEMLISFLGPVSTKACGFPNGAESKCHIPFEIIWFLHAKLLVCQQSRGQTAEKTSPGIKCSWAGKNNVRLSCLVESRKASPAFISKPSVPMVTLIINDEFLENFQLSNIAFPVVRSVLVCVWLQYFRHLLPKELAACNAFDLLTISSLST